MIDWFSNVSISSSMKIVLIRPHNTHRLFALRMAIDTPTSGRDDVRDKEVPKFAAGKDCAAFICDKGGDCLGYVQVTRKDDLTNGATLQIGLGNCGHIVRIGVISDARFKGVGMALLSKAEEWLKKKGKYGAWADYPVANQAAAQLFARGGYKVKTKFACDRGHHQRALAMKRWHLK